MSRILRGTIYQQAPSNAGRDLMKMTGDCLYINAYSYVWHGQVLLILLLIVHAVRMIASVFSGSLDAAPSFVLVCRCCPKTFGFSARSRTDPAHLRVSIPADRACSEKERVHKDLKPSLASNM